MADGRLSEREVGVHGEVGMVPPRDGFGKWLSA
jgi:hypothetical protein